MPLPSCLFHTHASTLFCLAWNVTLRFICRWYKEGNTYPLEAETRSGNSRDSVTTAVLTLTPSRVDDGAAYRCVVWNRAMPEGNKLEARVTLSVNCKSAAAVAQLRGSHDLITDACITVSLYVDSSVIHLHVSTPFIHLSIHPSNLPTYFKCKYCRTPLIRINWERRAIRICRKSG